MEETIGRNASMRTQLAPLEGKRARFSATFKSFGTRHGWHAREVTILLVDVTLNGHTVTDHVWMVMRKRMRHVNLKAGDKIAFDATVKSYVKGYRGHRDEDDMPMVSEDYKLAYPTKIRRLVAADGQSTLWQY